MIEMGRSWAPGCRSRREWGNHGDIGGLGSAVLESLSDGLGGQMPPVKRLGIPDTFTRDYGSQDSLLESFGLQPDAINEAVAQFSASTQTA